MKATALFVMVFVVGCYLRFHDAIAPIHALMLMCGGAMGMVMFSRNVSDHHMTNALGCALAFVLALMAIDGTLAEMLFVLTAGEFGVDKWEGLPR